MSKARQIGLSLAAAVFAVLIVMLLSRYVMDNAVSTTMAGLIGAIAFFVVWSLSKRS